MLAFLTEAGLAARVTFKVLCSSEPLPVVADLDRDRVARLLRTDQRRQVFGVGDRLAVDGHHDVPANGDLAGEGVDFEVATGDTGLGGGGAASTVSTRAPC